MGIMEQFTTRQQQVARLLAQGLTQRQIAHRLGIAQNTVYKHTGNMRTRSGINSTTTIAIKAMIDERQNT